MLMDKKELRTLIAQNKKETSRAAILDLSGPILRRLAVHPRFIAARTVLLYHSLPDANTTIPHIVRTPSIPTMDPPEVFLMPTVFTDRYYFMSLLKAEFNFETGRGFPISGLMYDRLENSLFIPKIYNGDYTSKREVDMTSRPLDEEFVIRQSLQAHELVEAYGKGRLKGKLKEIATTLDEESNPVIMLIKHKKNKY